MALSRVKTWISGETLTSSDLNAEFNNIINNAVSLISPVSGAFDFDGNTITLDAAGATQVVSSTAVSWNFTSGSKSGTPGTSGSIARFSAQTFTDSNTSGSGTAAAAVFYSIAQPTLAATNATVTTTDAATFYLAGAPTAGTNQTITNAWVMWLDDGNVRFDGSLRVDGGIIDTNGNELLLFGTTASAVNEVTITNAATGNRPRIAPTGGDTDIGLALRPKGTGSGASVVLEDGNGNEVLICGAATASAVNEVTVTNAATGTPPRIHASGETNVSLQIEPKGSGTVLLTDGTDTTKKVSFVLSGIATGTTRTLTMPNSNVDLQFSRAASDSVAGGIEIAVQSEMEAASSTTLAVTPGRQHFHPSSAKAWVNFDGTNTPTIRGDYNVDSITDSSAGDWVVNIDTNLSSTNSFVPVASGSGATIGNAVLIKTQVTGVGTVALNIEDTGGTEADIENIYLAVFGDI